MKIAIIVAMDKEFAQLAKLLDHATTTEHHGRTVVTGENGAPLLIEHGFNQGEKVRAIFTEQGYKNVATIKDLGGNDRVTFGSF